MDDDPGTPRLGRRRHPGDPAHDPEKDPKVATLSDVPEEVPDELRPKTATITFHQRIERDATLPLAASLLAVTVGGTVEIAPLFRLVSTIEEVEGMRPGTPFELAGRNV